MRVRIESTQLLRSSELIEEHDLARLKTERKMAYYRCGRCTGNIRYLPSDGKPDVCPQCGYGHGERRVNDIPSELKLNLSNLNQSETGSRGISEKTTITSR